MKWDHQWFLDLTNPVNRQAFDDAFNRSGWFAVPGSIDGLSELAGRMNQDGIETESKYTTGQDGAELGATTNDAGKWGGTIGAGITFGLEGQNSRGTSQLQGDDTMVLDHHDGSNAAWHPLSNYGLCGKKYFQYCQQTYGTCPTDTPSSSPANTITIDTTGTGFGGVGMAYTGFVGATDSDDSQDTHLSYSATGLPPGLKLDDIGEIVGRPSKDGDYKVTVTVADPTGAKSTTSFNISIAPY